MNLHGPTWQIMVKRLGFAGKDATAKNNTERNSFLEAVFLGMASEALPDLDDFCRRKGRLL